MTVLLKCRGLTAGYGSVVIVSELDLDVSAGSVLAVPGPQRCGQDEAADDNHRAPSSPRRRDRGRRTTVVRNPSGGRQQS
jgi:hypothetical protein